MNCLACNRVIRSDEQLKCVACKGCYHYKCYNLSTSFYKDNLNELKRQWKCQSCKQVTRRKDDNTPIRKQFSSPSADVTDVSCDDIIAQTVDATNINNCHRRSPCDVTLSAAITYDQFSVLLDSKLSDMRSAIKEDINCAISKLKSEFSETTDHLAAMQSDMRMELDIATKRISKMETEKTALELQINKLDSRISTLERVSRGCNFELQCVPEKKNENLMTIVRNLLTEIKISSSEAHIKAIRRVAKIDKNSDRPRGILVTLPSERDRDNVISAYKRYNKDNKASQLNSAHLGIHGEERPVYVSEHLSPETKQLHAAARLAGKNLSYKYIWIKYGRVYMRKNDDSNAIHVKNASTLNTLK